jgi:hypothetical protein
MPTDADVTDDYDRRAYDVLVAQLSEGPSLVSRWADRTKEVVAPVGRRVRLVVPSNIREVSGDALALALSGLRSMTIDPAFRSIRTGRVVLAYQRAGTDVSALDEIRHLPLRTIDRTMPSLLWRYAAAAAAEGATAGVAITGAEVLAAAGTVSSAGAAAAPGAGVVVGAIAADAAATLAASARVISHVGAYYGYDTRLPDEQVFALALFGWSSATGEGAKTAAFQQLSRLTQKLMRGAPWAQLSEFTLVKVLDDLYLRLGFRLTKAKLGQAVPVAGVLIGAGLNARILQTVARDAQTAYRMRHLAEKYGVTFPAVGTAGSQQAESEPIDVLAILEEAEALAEPTGSQLLPPSVSLEAEG